MKVEYGGIYRCKDGLIRQYWSNMYSEYSPNMITCGTYNGVGEFMCYERMFRDALEEQAIQRVKARNK